MHPADIELHLPHPMGKNVAGVSRLLGVGAQTQAAQGGGRSVLGQAKHVQPVQQPFLPGRQIHPIFPQEDQHVQPDDFGRRFLRLQGQLLHIPDGFCVAEVPQRAVFTVRRPRHADPGPQVHQGLVKIPRPIRWDQGAGCFRKLLLNRGQGDVLPDALGAGQHASQVSVDRRLRQSKGDGGHRRRRIGPDARQPAQQIDVRRKPAAVLLRHHPGRFQKVSGPGIIAKAFPQLQDLFLRSLRQGADIREPPKKALIITLGRHRPGLLQHDFTEPDPVRVLRSPEGQHPLILVVPIQHQLRKRLFHAPLPALRVFDRIRQDH